MADLRSAYDYARKNQGTIFAQEFKRRFDSGDLDKDIEASGLNLGKMARKLGSTRELPEYATEGILKKAYSATANYFTGISGAFKEAEQYGEEMQSRRSETENRTFLNPGRLVSRGLEEVGRPILGAIEGATAPIAKAGIAVGKAVLNDKQEEFVADTASNLAQKYEDFKSNLSPEARVQFDEVATLFGLGSSLTGGAAALKLGKTGIKGAKTGIKTAIESPDFKQGVDLGFEGGQKARGAVIDTAASLKTKTQKTTQGLTELADKKAIEIINSSNKLLPSDAEKFLKLSKGQTLGEYLAKRNIIETDPEKSTIELAKRWQNVKKDFDKNFDNLSGLYRPESANTVLKELRKFYTDTESTKQLSRVNELNSLFRERGLQPKEILELKRLYEKDIKLGYKFDKTASGKTIARSTNRDSALRKDLYAIAKEQGFENVQDFAKEIQLAKAAADGIFKKLNRQLPNNALGLTDNLTFLAGAIEPASFILTGSKKLLELPAIKTKIAKKLAKTRKKQTLKNPEIIKAKMLPAPKAIQVKKFIPKNMEEVELARKTNPEF